MPRGGGQFSLGKKPEYEIFTKLHRSVKINVPLIHARWFISFRFSVTILGLGCVIHAYRNALLPLPPTMFLSSTIKIL